MIYKMGNISYSTNVRDLSVKSVVILMIDQAIVPTLTHIWEELRVQHEKIMDNGVAIDVFTA